MAFKDIFPPNATRPAFLLAACVVALSASPARAGVGVADFFKMFQGMLPVAVKEEVSPAPPELLSCEGQEHLAGLSPEQRQQMREQMREQWQAPPPDDREAFRQRRRESWQQMAPEERQRIRQDMIQNVPAGFDPGRPPPQHRRWE